MSRLIRKCLRKLGFRIHKGWRKTHRSGYKIQCVGCGEKRSQMTAWVSPPMADWWETDESGDGSCGQIKELPSRLY